MGPKIKIQAKHFKGYVINTCQKSKLKYGSLNSLKVCYRSVPIILSCLLQPKQHTQLFLRVGVKRGF
jgi:hypothetical protein